MDALKAKIRQVPDFPKPGILFYDVTTLLRDADGFRLSIDARRAVQGAARSTWSSASRAAASSSAPPSPIALGAGFVPVRKVGKLPSTKIRVTYDLEYGTDSLEMHSDAVDRGRRS